MTPPSGMSQLAIVVPCYNEATRFDADAFLRYRAQHPEVHFVLVDDGSTDDTLRILRETAERDPEGTRVVMQSENGGKAEAVRCGLLEAMRAGGVSVVGYWDADLATPLRAIHEMAGFLERAPHLELVIASRVQLLGRRIERDPYRHYAGRVFATCASMLLRMPVYDTQCGAKLFRVSPTLLDAVRDPFVTSWTFDVELLSRLQGLRARAGLVPVEEVTYEFPLERWTDVDGSKVRAKDFPLALRDLARIGWRHRRGYDGA